VGFLVAVLCLAGAIIGASVSLRAFSPMTVHTKLADVQTQTHLSTHGRFALKVPVVDWGIRADARGLPLDMKAQVARVDRERAATAIGPDPAAPRRTLAQVRQDGHRVIARTVTRAIWCMLLGALAGGLFVGAICGAVLHRRELLVVGMLVGLLLPLGASPAFFSALHNLKKQDVSDVEFTGQGKELGQVVAFAEQLLYVQDDYSKLYSRALGSAQNIISFTEQGRKRAKKPSGEILVASDLHDNVLVTDSFDRFAGKRPVFMAGDFGQVGAKVEESLAGDIAALGSQVIAVSGNHDSRSFMRALSGQGVLVLTSTGTLNADGSVDAARVVVDVAGLKVAGYTDPLEKDAPGDGNPDHVLRVYGEQYERQADDLIKWFDNLPERPDAVMIHQHGLAHRLMEHLASKGDNRPLIVITGHDHKAHVDQQGAQLLVDGGTLGAGGPFAIGEQSSAFVKLSLAGTQPTAADMVTINPLTGTSAVRHVELDGIDHRSWPADEVLDLGEDQSELVSLEIPETAARKLAR
jgi:predicted phosphodiesterase